MDFEKAKGEKGSILRTIWSLPGIEGYKDKELRRAADKQLRDDLARSLDQQRQRITGLQQELLARGGLLLIDDLERLVSRLQLLIDRVRTAAYGYAPFFDLQQVKEAELDRLIQFDQSLSDLVPKLDQAVTGLATAVGTNEKVPEAIQAVGDAIGELTDAFGRRAEALQAAE